ncbi:MAG: hypothetical protein LLG16_02065 [Euryarchaeota archaeon]|nr:hypothetical protein [Euryarchaeota archaeon]
MLCESSCHELEPRLELYSHRPIKGPDQQSSGYLAATRDQFIFGAVATSRVLCRCGAVAELDRSVMRTKRDLGKAVECRRCRNDRIAREKEELDAEFFGLQENNE